MDLVSTIQWCVWVALPVIYLICRIDAKMHRVKEFSNFGNINFSSHNLLIVRSEELLQVVNREQVLHDITKCINIKRVLLNT